MNSYTPRHLRRKGNAGRNGSVDKTKSQAFRTAAQLSKQFIHQSASALESPKMRERYAEYCRRSDANSLRKGS